MEVQTTSVVKFQQRTDQCLALVDRATTALVSARELLNIEGLEEVAITVEALKARGKLLRDERAKQAAYNFDVERLVTAAWIAQRIVDRDKPVYRTGRGKGFNMQLTAAGVLGRAGWSAAEAVKSVNVGRLTKPELVAARKKRATITSLVKKAQGRGRQSTTSPVYCRIVNGDGSARGLSCARSTCKSQLLEDYDDLTDAAEIISVRNRLTEIRDWCDARLKQLKVKR